MTYRRSKLVRSRNFAAGRCPEPCGKTRFLTRAAARKCRDTMSGQGRNLRPYPGEEGTCCAGFWHLATRSDSMKITKHREALDLATQHGLPPGWRVFVNREGARWRFVVVPPGEKPCPSVHTYASREVALAEAVADVLGVPVPGPGQAMAARPVVRA